VLGWTGTSWFLIACTACAGGVAGSSELPTPPALSGPTATSAVVTVTEPTPAHALNLLLDDDGRPYDAPVQAGVTVETRPLTTLDIEGGELRVMDGNALQILPDTPESAVHFRGAERLDVSVVWERFASGEEVLGVRVQVPGSGPVQHWDRFRRAYGTDGGVGGITSEAVVRRAQAVGIDGWSEPSLDDAHGVHVLDLDGLPGDDSLIFANGWGDGGFPLAEGRDAHGQVVAAVIWDARYPWRLAVPDGTPPPDVVEREQEMADCIAGRRPVEVYDNRKTCS
jgi:hypothetical protein